MGVTTKIGILGGWTSGVVRRSRPIFRTGAHRQRCVEFNATFVR